jgi:hypothetical protein
MSDQVGALPEAAERRLKAPAFSSGLSIPQFEACLEMGLRPLALVQGFCVMQWGWAPNMWAGQSGWPGAYSRTFRCPHGYVSQEHVLYGYNYEQPWLERTWAQGYGTAYERMIAEARELGAHGILAVVDRASRLIDSDVTEFHLLGTAVVVEDCPPPRGEPWTTYLAGQHLAKVIEAGLAPVSIVASLASVAISPYCMTEYQLRGGSWNYGYQPGEIEQVADAHRAARRLAREHLRTRLGHDVLHGVETSIHEYGGHGRDEVVECTLKGNRLRRVRDFEPMAAPRPTVSLA